MTVQRDMLKITEEESTVRYEGGVSTVKYEREQGG